MKFTRWVGSVTEVRGSEGRASQKKDEQEPQKPTSSFQRTLNLYEERVRSSMDSILTTNEVSKMRKGYLEKFIVRHSELFGKDLTLCSRRTYTPECIIGLQFENRDKDITIAELKLKRIGKGDLDNLRRCMHRLSEITRKNVYGIVVCRDVSPTIVDELKKQQDIQVFRFGWKLLVYPKHWD